VTRWQEDRAYLDALRIACGMPRIGHPGADALEYDALRRTEWSGEFEQLMRNRLIMGALRYGVFGDRRKPAYDRMARAERLIAQYRETRNREALVDLANMALCEYVEGRGHWEPQDDGEHTEISA